MIKFMNHYQNRFVNIHVARLRRIELVMSHVTVILPGDVIAAGNIN